MHPKTINGVIGKQTASEDPNAPKQPEGAADGDQPAAAPPAAPPRPLTAVEELETRRAHLKLGGGEAALAKRRAAGQLTARARLDLLLDPESFQETFLHARHHGTNFGMAEKELPGDGVVTGYGAIAGRGVCVASQDFTVSGGSVGAAHARKIVETMKTGLKCGQPIIIINDSGGARIQEGVDSLDGYGDIFYHNVLASGVVPQISIIAGPCAGGAVYSPALTDFIIIVKGQKMFITGPDVIKQVTGEEVTAEKLGGAQTHASVSGNAHFIAENDEHAMQICQRLLSFLPANNLEDPPRMGSWTRENAIDTREVPELDTLLPENPRMAFDVKGIIRALVDDGDFFEVMEPWARNIVIGFARVSGFTVGVIANQPSVKSGVLDIDTSDKASRLIRFCNAFNIPLLTLVDVPGYMPGVEQEHGGIIRHGAKMLFAYSAATVPKITVILRKAYGGAYLAMCGKALGADRSYAWPTAEIAVMGAEGAVPLIFRREIAAATDKAAKRSELIADYREKFSNPYEAAARGMVDDVILPRETRRYVSQALLALRTKRETRPNKKHGLMPL